MFTLSYSRILISERKIVIIPLIKIFTLLTINSTNEEINISLIIIKHSEMEEIINALS